MTPLTPPETKRAALFIGTRAPSKPAPAEAPVVDVTVLAPDDHQLPTDPGRDAVASEERSASAPALDDSRAEAVAATEAMPWLFADPQTSDAKHTPPAPLAGIVTGHMPDGDVAAPEEAAQALSGLPYIDQTGEEHQPEAAPIVPRPSGRMHRIDFDVAGILERMAERVRAGEIDVGSIDATAGDAAALAAVLAALLRQRAL